MILVIAIYLSYMNAKRSVRRISLGSERFLHEANYNEFVANDSSTKIR